MKYSAPLLLLVTAVAMPCASWAFVVVAPTAKSTTTTAAFMSKTTGRLDTSEQVAAAMEASRLYGPTSVQARLAWDIVEEMDAADNSAAYATRSLDTECMVEEEISQECVEYGEQLDELVKFVETQGSAASPSGSSSMAQKTVLAREMDPIPFPAPATSGGPGNVEAVPDLAQLKQAVAHAEALVAQARANYVHPADIKLAWEEVEELIERTEKLRENAYLNLDQECLVYEQRLATACQALEELDRVINLQRTVDDNLASF